MNLSFGTSSFKHSKSFTLKALKNGKFILNKNNFYNIPHNYNIIELEVEVK